MSARIVVLSGGSTAREYWVQDDVVRIGSAAGCALRVVAAGVEEHAATLEYHTGRYLLHNRSGRGLRLAGLEIETRGTAVWSEGQELELSDGMVLRLETGSDPAPSPVFLNAYRPPEDEVGAEPAAAADPAARGATPDDSGARERRKQTMQIGVIATCLALLPVLGLLAARQPTAADEAGGGSASFEAVVGAIGGESPADRGLRRLLDDARIQELHGDRDRAWLLYGRARDRLLGRRGPQGSFPHEGEQAAYRFVLGRLELLTPGR